MKVLLLVLDGGGDIGKPTPLERARKPRMNGLAKVGRVGLLDIGYRKEVNSDFGYLHLLSSYSKKEYPGRGYLEALGIGLKPGPDDICIRGNFATLDSQGNIVDRRAGRDETGLDTLAGKLDGMEIDGVHFTVRHSAGHRVVLVLSGKNLSENIVPNDPLRIGVPLPQIKTRDTRAKRTASVLNKFVRETHRILSQHPVNLKRVVPANVILIRNTGKRKDAVSFEKRFGLKACCIAGIPIAKGVARFLGMDVIEVPGANGMPSTNLAGKTKAAIRALKQYRLVFLHINGTDILSHDAKPELKRRFIEKIDRELGKLLERAPADLITVVTCDHRTASSPAFRGYRHLPDPVPVLVSGTGIKPNGIDTFSESSCKRGFKLKGNQLILFVKKLHT